MAKAGKPSNSEHDARPSSGMSVATPNIRRSLGEQEVTLPSPLVDVLFLTALLVPIAMYLGGLMILAVWLLLKHFAPAHERPHSMEAPAH
jgi:hypothetical protein